MKNLLKKYAPAFEITPVPMLLASDTGEILIANSRICALFEYDDGELLGRSVEVLVPESARANHPELRSAYAKVPAKRNMGAGRDLTGITKFGNTIPLELGLEPLFEKGQVFALVAAIDIRHRKAHEVRLRQAMNAAASAMVMVDANGRIVFVNKAVLDLFGYDEGKLIGAPVEILIPEEFHRAHPVYVESFLSKSRARSMGLGRDLFARHNDGRRIPVEISLTPVSSPEGEMVMSTIIDLSERVAAADAIRKKQGELEFLNTELTQFAYSASHDLKAPLSSITGLLNLCIEDLDEGNHDDLRENLKKATEIGARSARKIEGILEIARAGRGTIPPEMVALEATTLEVWSDLTGGLRDDTDLVIAVDGPDAVCIERPTLKVVLENILSNALRYRDPAKADHVIRVDYMIDADSLDIRIADNGLGIPEESRAVVFEMFKRIDERSGDGLGLTLVRKQVVRLGGSIRFTSSEGVGTTFIINLPIPGKQLGKA